MSFADRPLNGLCRFALCLVVLACSGASWCGEPAPARAAAKDFREAADLQLVEVGDVGAIDVVEGLMPRLGVAGDLDSEYRRALEKTMQRKMDLVDYVCKLTDVQKRRLRLASRGDVKHVLDEIRAVRASFEEIDDNPKQVVVQPGGVEGVQLRRYPLTNGFNDSLLFEKLLKTELTPEQAGKYLALRDISRLKGKIHLRVQGAGKEMESHLEIVVSGTAFTDDDLLHISTLPNVTDLRLDSTRITDAGLVHLQKMTSLLKLHLNGCQGIGDAGMAHLNPLANLSFLRLDNTRVGDAGLAQLMDLKNVNYLFMNDTHVTDAGMASLASMSGLYLLWLDRTDVGDAGLVPFLRLTNLRELQLSGTHVTDAGLKHLKPMPRLKTLVLTGRPITDAGLAHLKGMTTLWELNLHQTAVTDKGVVDLERVLPYVRVIR